MDRGPLDHPLKRGGGHGFGAVDIRHQCRQVIVDEFHQRLAQFVQIDGTGAHDLGSLGFIQQRQKQMFKRRKFVLAGIGQRQRSVNGLFERVRK